jgi:diacylglycerol O-acyltransferase / wax synthase
MVDKPRRVPMSNVDKAWLEMDSATNLMIINGVLFFEGKIEFEELKRVLLDRFVSRYDRFRQRVVGQGGRLYWEDDPHFDIRAHVRRYALPEPADMATLQTVVSAIVNEPLDRRKPLWRYLLIENVEGGSVLLARLHHCIGDGIALIKVLLDMTGTSPEASRRILEGRYERRRGPSNPIDPLIHLAQEALAGTRSFLKTAAGQTLQTFEDPHHPLEIARSAGIISAAGAAIIAKLLILPPDRPSVFQGELGAIKRVVWSEPFDLQRVKLLGNSLGATINDVLVAAVAGALRRYMVASGDDPATGDITAMVPVNLRPPSDNRELGNEFALVYLSLPVSYEDPYDRLTMTKRHMDVLKNSPEPFLVYQILGAIGALPLDLARQATTWFSTKASAVLTNVPGPREQLYFAGTALTNLMFWVPQSGEIGLGISIISYNGRVMLGIMIDERLVSNPQLIMAGFADELATLEARVFARNATQVNGAVDAGVAQPSTTGRVAGRAAKKTRQRP